ncbi:hypothetical protein QHH03_24480, partial [Aphanizomenon sp. 202]|nr:hypothetical protein [Aphanizomenon sp. 202]
NTIKPNCVKKRKIAENFFTLASCLLPCHNDNFQRQPTYCADKILSKQTDNNQVKLDSLLELRIDFGSFVNDNNLRSE